MLKSYIDTNKYIGIIQRSTLPGAASILFAKNMNWVLMLCVYDAVLNLATVKNEYALWLILAMLHYVCQAMIFMKLLLWGACYLIKIKDGNDYKPAVWMCHGQFAYPVMPLNLTNALAMYEFYIDNNLQPYIDDFMVCYLHYTLIHLRKEKEH